MIPLSRVLTIGILCAGLAVSATANPLWTPLEGRTLFVNQEPLLQTALPGLNDGELLLLWTQRAGHEGELVGQVVDDRLLPMWESVGRRLLGSPGIPEEVTGVQTGDGWVLAWRDGRSTATSRQPRPIWLQHFDAAGTPHWGLPGDPHPSGIPLFADNRSPETFQLLSAPDGGLFILAGLDGDNPSPYAFELRLLRLNADGTTHPGWPEDGLLLASSMDSSACRKPETVALIASDDGSVLVTWLGQYVVRPNTNEFFRYFCQRILPDGNVAWPEALRLWVGAGARAVSDGMGGALILWAAERSSGTTEQSALYGERLTPDGEFIGGGEGLFITETDNSPSVVNLWATSTGECVVAWQYWHWFWNHAMQRVRIVDDAEALWDEAIAVSGVTLVNGLPDGVGGLVFAAPEHFQHITADGERVFDGLGGLDLGTEPPNAARLAGDRMALAATWWDSTEAHITLSHYDPVQRVFQTPTDGVPLASGPRGEVRGLTTPSLGVGPDHVSVLWFDSRAGGGLPAAQCLDLSTGAQRLPDRGEALYSDGLDGPWMVWQVVAHNRSGVGFHIGPQDNGLHLQRVEPSGERPWGPAGVVLTRGTDGMNGQRFALIPWEDGEIGAAFGYIQYGDYLIGYTCLAEDGTVLVQTDEQEFVDVGGPYEPELITVSGPTASDTAFYMLYEQEGETQLQRIGRDGYPWWGQAKNLGDTRTPVLTAAGEGVLVFWRGPSWQDEIRGQYYDAEGNPQWEAPYRVFFDDEYQQPADVLTGPSGESFWLAGYSSGSGANKPHWAQRFRLDGSPLTDLYQGEGYWLRLATQPDGSVYMACSRETPAPDSDAREIVLTHLPAEGGIEPGTEPSVTVGSAWDCWPMDLVADGDGGVVLLYSRDDAVTAQRFQFGVTSAPEPRSITPVAWSLSPVAPNPFNSMTSVTVSLPTRGHVDARLFDMLGREVMVLQQATLPAGTHRLLVDGSHLSSGTYILRASAAGHSALSRKLTLVK